MSSTRATLPPLPHSRILRLPRERRTLIVITSDRALAEYVRRCGARVLRSGEFRQRLDEAIKEKTAPPAAEESDTIADGELKNWLRYFGVEEDE
ncbi:MAG: NYN domain-containing protein [Acidobacteria bacterium]|nr:NYN domain-containing protein [Acidobacteriota bacterium]